ncbi:esterase [Metarhizium album ARSEF 1941]|uniref:Esterase n=1 Tax=Metarhizium album (strain ARSEF 1941) TaxID=1081103 RepID=A0A0B2WY48_METAS|nr:esterase [Metarhizium album ARSEF 1941]KHN98983.1 esterase [Metarhizium album ARSEF 1941]
MASWRARLLSWYLWLWCKGDFTSAEALHKRIAKARKHAPDYRPPQHLSTKFMVEERQANGYPVFEVAPKSETPNAARILYLHGGSFMFEIQRPHWTLIALLAERLQASVTVPIYPLGPEKKLKDMYGMLQPIHDEMAASRDGSPFLVVGDSAGGCMALVLAQEAIRAGTRLAAGLVAITPVVDATFTNTEAHELSKRDPWLDVVGCIEVGELVRGEWPTDDARLRPLFGDVDGMPPMMLFAAGEDLLTPDTKRFAEKAAAAGRHVTLVEGPGMMHVWPVVLPHHDGKEAIDKMVEWMAARKP